MKSLYISSYYIRSWKMNMRAEAGRNNHQ